MNMEEWQRKLKAEKDAARQKKTESAEMLRGYRGEIKDDDLKLKVLREEERKRQLDAQQNLHNYKNTQLQDVISKPKGQRPEQHYPTPVNAGENSASKDVLDGIVMGSVSERAAVFDANPSAGELVSAPTDEQQYTSTATAAPVSAPDTAEDDDDDDDYGPTAAPSTDPVGTDPFAAASSLKDPLAGELPSEKPLEDPTSSALGKPIEAASQTVEPPIAIPAMQPEVPLVSPSVADMPVATAKNGLTTATSSTQIEALFSFGLVTIRSQPELTSYMKAVQSIAVISSRESKGQFVYESSNMPFVKDLQWDGTSDH
jgi:hypothetical protein